MTGEAHLKGKKALVTGATGFIGRRLVDALVREETIVTAVARNRKRAERLLGPGVNVIEASLSDAERLVEATRDQDTVFNLAYDFTNSAKSNVAATQNLAQACTASGVEKLIHVSSIVVYDGWPTQDVDEASAIATPSYPYQEAKIEIEKDLLRRHREGSLSSVILQPTIVYGPGSAQWTDLQSERLLDGKVMLPNGGCGVCNAVYVDDVIGALLCAALVQDQVGERFIISGPIPTTWRDLFSMYQEALGVDAIEFYEPVPNTIQSDQKGSGLGRLLNSPIVSRLIRGVRNSIGDDNTKNLKRMLARMARLGRPAVFYPSPSEANLYNALGKCSIDKAKNGLGYAPTFDLNAAREPTSDYIKSKYLKH